MVGRTRRGSYSWKGVFLPSRCLLESPFLEPLRRTLLRTLPPSKAHCKTPSKNPCWNRLESTLKNPSRKPFLEGVLSHDPLGVHPREHPQPPPENSEVTQTWLKAPFGVSPKATLKETESSFLPVLSATFILSKKSRVLDAKSRLKSANLG